MPQGHPIVWKQQIVSRFGKAYQLPASYAGAARYNAGARDWLSKQAVDAYECLLNGGQRDWDAEVEKIFLNDSVLVVRELLFDIYCGGNHSNSSTAHRTYDPRTGKAIDTWTWMKGGAALSERLRALIEKRHMKHSDEQCAAGFSIAPPYPGLNGLTFPLNYFWALRACDNDVEVSYKDLKPYLTRDGREISKSFARP